MQSTTKTVSVLLLVSVLPLAAADHYGPHQCVSVERSNQGSCVFKTNCKGIDTSKFEFAFSCTGKDGSHTKHSFGIGGFDEVEEYDTEVKCHGCHQPASAVAAAAVAAEEVAFASHRSPTKEEKFQVTKYGPNKCISTYLSEKGTCIVKTDCGDKALDGISMGLVCADQQGDMVRHVFNDNAFEHKETFDTLIPCNQCLSLDNFDSGKDTEEQVLKDEVENLKKDVSSAKAAFSKDLKDLQQRVGALEKAEGGAEAKAEEPPKAFLRASSHKRRHAALRHRELQHHAKKRRHVAHRHAEKEDDEEQEQEQESSESQEDHTDSSAEQRADDEQDNSEDSEDVGRDQQEEEQEDEKKGEEEKEEADDEDVDTESS